MLLDEIGAGPPLLCMPGGPGFAARHLGTLGGLDRSRRLIRINTRGAGGSEPPRGNTFSLDDYCTDIDAVVSTLDLNRIDLFGHSHGAWVAARYAATRDHVRRVVLDAMPGRREEMPTPSGIEAYFSTWGPSAQSYVEDELTERFVGSFEWVEQHEWPTLDPDGDISRITAPALFITGSQDWACGAERAARMAALAPHGRAAVIEHAGHFAWMEQPRAYSSAVEDFLSAD